MKFIVVLGGVMSSLGKGITASSIGVLMQSLGKKVTMVKIDPYLNCDAGTMSPHQHGEVFVLDDGSEVDLDLGNYERFLDTNLTSDHSITTGKIYKSVIDNERKGKYLGQTVQVIPHITDEIQDRLKKVAADQDVCIVELGGTVGDIESLPFLNALNCLSLQKDIQVIFILVSFIPVMKCGSGASEQKTKPTQHTIAQLHEQSIWPSSIICRCDEMVSSETLKKISKTCQVPINGVISCHNVDFIQMVPHMFHDQKLTKYLGLLLFDETFIEGLVASEELLDGWTRRIAGLRRIHSDDEELFKICIVGKYTGKTDTYLSVTKAVQHAFASLDAPVSVEFRAHVDMDEILKFDGIIIPGGFGDRGVQDKVDAIMLARRCKIPLLGICLGLQAMVIAAMRNVPGGADANSTEFDPDTSCPIVDVMKNYDGSLQKGASMRLGRADITVTNADLAKTYGVRPGDVVHERHRHRYEVAYEKYSSELKEAGIQVTAFGNGDIVEAIQWPLFDVYGNDVYFNATQYHPEFLSRPGKPSGPFLGLAKFVVYGKK